MAGKFARIKLGWWGWVPYSWWNDLDFLFCKDPSLCMASQWWVAISSIKSKRRVSFWVSSNERPSICSESDARL